MKRIQRSKEPSVRQMLNMARNLREKFDKFAVVEVSGRAYFESGNAKNEYGIYIEDTVSTKTFKTWKACQDKYFELMKK